MRNSRREQPHEGVKLVFRDISVTLGKTKFLNNVSGVANVDQMLAIMGLSGNNAVQFTYGQPNSFRLCSSKSETNIVHLGLL